MYIGRYTSHMEALVWTLLSANVILILLLAALPLSKLQLSEFALRERLHGLPKSRSTLIRILHKNLAQLKAARVSGLVICGSILIAMLGWLLDSWTLALVYGLLIFLVISLIKKLNFINRLSEIFFVKIADQLVPVLKATRPILGILAGDANPALLAPSNTAEFTDQLQRLPSTVLSPLQRQRLEKVLAAENLTVKDIMTPKKRVVLVEPSSTLGPVLLTDLQKSGHRYFPVAKKKGDIEGLLNLSDAADVSQSKNHQKVKDVMQTQFAVAEEDEPLYKLAESFLREKEYVLLVFNQKGDFKGLVSIADFMRQVLSVVTEE